MPAINQLKPLKKPKKNLHNLYLGVDGGGTKTHAVLIDENCKVVSQGFGGASNPLRVGIEVATSNIFKALTEACDRGDRSRGDIVAATMGLAGVRRADLRDRIREGLIKQLRLKNLEVITDAEIALYGATLGKAGLVVIAGTGSVCIGQDEKGNRAVAGGWGPLAGDEGGGAGIARRALQAIAKASDGRARPTKLTDAAIEYFRAASPEDLVVAIYAPQVDNAKIAGFAKYVVETAQASDATAKEVIAEAGIELAASANAVIKSLKLENKKFPIGYVGGIFKAGKLLTDSLKADVHSVAPKSFLSEPKLNPALAAANLAYMGYNL